MKNDKEVIFKHEGNGSMKELVLPKKGIMGIVRAKADGMGSLYTGKNESYYFENGKFFNLKVIGNMNYNKQFPRRKPILGIWDEYTIKELE